MRVTAEHQHLADHAQTEQTNARLTPNSQRASRPMRVAAKRTNGPRLMRHGRTGPRLAYALAAKRANGPRLMRHGRTGRAYARRGETDQRASPLAERDERAPRA